ncbi:2TM domain-containing protein [Flagellimonas crocea]|uniref:2TM domain-containing protein n=1 Tax=Flagellimonas crocea TaxID=3067311 RepID=UPI00296E5A0E|nr:2TM domain-containing protein [Muricauda sp. DH64]
MKNTNEDRYIKARKKVERIKCFYHNLTAYCVIIPFLVFINMRTTDIPWSVFPAIGWGMGLVVQWMAAYGHDPLFGKDWEERKIQEFMNDKEF